MAKLEKLVRGEIYLVNFDPTIGSEIRKTRPALIIQNDVANKHSPVTIVAAITSQYDGKLYPTEVLIPENEAGMKKPSVVLLNQIRSIDKSRLVKKMGKVSNRTLLRINTSIKISLGLVEF